MLLSRISLLTISVALSVISHARAELPPLRDRAVLGAYVRGLPYFPESARAFDVLEKRLGTKLPILSGFIDWQYVLGEPRDLALSKGGSRVLLYSWEPHCGAGRTDDAGGACISFASVARGDQDAYLERVAASMRRFPYTIYVRPWGEMNAEWSAWQPNSGRPRAGTTAEFIAAWRHLVDFFRVRGIDNLKFVFNPDAANDETSVPIAALWPGAEYVDVLGIDGYNWGNGAPGSWGKWEEFEEIFTPMYGILTALHETAPVWICEFGSKEPQKTEGDKRPSPRDPKHSKGRWLRGVFGSTAFPRVTALVHFNVDKERDFRFESSGDALKAVRRELGLRKVAVPPPGKQAAVGGDHSTRTSRSPGMPATISTKQSSTASSTRPSIVSLVR
jgi:hypothetical protein